MGQPIFVDETGSRQPASIIPEPPLRRRRGALRVVVLVAVASGVTLGWLHQTRVDRWLRQVEAYQGTWHSYRRADILRWLVAEGDDPRITAALVSELEQAAGSGGYDLHELMAWLVPELERRQPPVDHRYLDGLVGLYAHHELVGCVTLARAMSPEDRQRLVERGRSSDDPGRRFAGLLLGCEVGLGSVQDVSLIVAGVEAESKGQGLGMAVLFESEFEPSSRHRAARRALLGIGSDAVPALVKAFESTDRTVANLCAGVLNELDPEALVSQIERWLDEYQDRAPEIFAAERQLEGGRQALHEAGIHPGRVEDSLLEIKGFGEQRQVIAAGHHLAFLAAEGLVALDGSGSEGPSLDARRAQRPEVELGVDLCFMRALSSHNEAVAKYCARQLEQRLHRDDYIDMLFTFVARKATFRGSELEVYKQALVRFGAAASAGVVRNLERLLQAADGDLESVYWVHKLIALEVLEDVGEADAYPVLVRYAADPGGFMVAETTGLTERTERNVFFRDLCRKALDAIQGRSGVPAPEVSAPDEEVEPEPGEEGGG